MQGKRLCRINATRKRIPNWMSKHPVFGTILKQISDDHQYPEEPSAALAYLMQIIEKARKRTGHELLRNTPGSPGAKLLIAATAMRARGTYMWAHSCTCCAAWEPVGQCFDRYSFECTTFHGLCQIIASLTRESIAERETAVHGLPWTQTEKDNALAKCRLSVRAWVSEKPMLCLHGVTDEEGYPFEDEDESGMIL